MKKLIASLLVLGVVLTGAGCAEEKTDGTVPSEAPQTMETVTVPTVPPEALLPDLPMYAVAMEPVTEVLRSDDGTELFSCSYPKLSVVLDGCPAEKTIAADMERRMEGLLKEAEAIRHSAQLDYAGQQDWTARYARAEYELTRLDENVMSMFAQFEYHSGGIHPSQSTGSVTYDLTDGRELTLGDILAEGWSGEDMAQKVCAALSHRAADLYPDFAEVIRARFAGGMEDSTAWYLTGDGLCFHFAPYDIAAPFAGAVTAQIPYGELEGLLRQEFLPRQETAKGGVYAQLQQETPEDMLTVCLDPQGERVRILTDGSVTDLRVEVGQQTEDGFLPEALVFAAGTMGVGDGVCLQADLQAYVIRLSYRSDGQEVSTVVSYDTAQQRLIDG